MKNKFNIFDNEVAISSFATIFKKEIDKIKNDWTQKVSISNYITEKGNINWIQNITSWFWNWTKYMTKINGDVRYFWPFIEWMDKELLNLSCCFKDIDIYLKWNKILYKEQGKGDKSISLKYINEINGRLYNLETEHIILTLSRLFDDNSLKDKSLNKRFNLRTFLRDCVDKEEINVKTYLTYLNSYIDTFDKYVHKKYYTLFNSYKHNFIGDDKYNEKNSCI